MTGRTNHPDGAALRARTEPGVGRGIGGEVGVHRGSGLCAVHHDSGPVRPTRPAAPRSGRDEPTIDTTSPASNWSITSRSVRPADPRCCEPRQP